MRLSDFVDERLKLIKVGGFSPVGQVAHIDYLNLMQTRVPEEVITVLHEEVHFELTMRSDLGVFEVFIGKLIEPVFAPESEVEKAHSILQDTVGSSWLTHESCAEYVSAMQVFKGSHDRFLAYLDSRPDDPPYKTALLAYSTVLGLPPATGGTESTRSVALCRLAGCISEAALNVPILTRFKSYPDVTKEEVAHFLKLHNPDARQEKILTRLRDQEILSHLLDAAESFLEKEVPKIQSKGVIDAFRELALILADLDMVLMKELQVLLPEMSIWLPESKRIEQWQAVWEAWRNEWISRGYEGAEQQKLIIRAASNGTVRHIIDDYLERIIVGIVTEDIPFYRLIFTPLSLDAIKTNIEAVRAIHADILVCVGYNSSETPIKLGSGIRWEAQSVTFHACSWQLHNNQPPHAVPRSCLSFSCPIEQAREVIGIWSSPKTVWVRWLECEKEILNLGKELPEFDGISFICAMSSSAAQVIETCKQLAAQSSLIAHFITARSRTLEVKEQAMFLAAVVPDKRTSYIFPVSLPMSPVIKEALADIDNITFLEELEEVRAMEDIEIHNEIMLLFYGVDEPALVKVSVGSQKEDGLQC